MIRYLLRRIVYGFLILLGVNLLTFLIFFAVNTPDDMARIAIGGKYVSAEAIADWKHVHGYDKPLIWNGSAPGTEKVTKTIFWERSVPLLRMDFGTSDRGRSINKEIADRAWPSLALALPTFLLGVIAMTSLALLIVLFRRTRLESGGLVGCVILMSISSLFYIIVGQWLFARLMKLVPISGYANGWHAAVFLILPVAIGVLSRMGSDTLLYRTMFLEEIGNSARERNARIPDSLPPRSPECVSPDHHVDRCRDPASLHGVACHGKLLRHSRSRQLHDRRNQ